MKNRLSFAAVAALTLLTSVVQAKTIAYWPLTYKNGQFTGQCAVNPLNDLTVMAGVYDRGALPAEWNLPPNLDPVETFLFTPAAYSSVSCTANGDGGKNGALLSNTQAYLASHVCTTNDFTVEGWYYIPKAGMPGSWRILIQGCNGSGGPGGWCLSLRLTSGTTMPYYNLYVQNGRGTGAIIADTNIHNFPTIESVADQWNHVAVAFQYDKGNGLSNWKVYHNGAKVRDQDMAQMQLEKALDNRFEIGGRNNSAAQRAMASYCCWRVSDEALIPERFLNYDPEGKGGKIVPEVVLPVTATVAYWKLGQNLDGTLNLADSVGVFDLHGGMFNACTPFDGGESCVTNTRSQFVAAFDNAFAGNPPNGDLGVMGNRGSILARQRDLMNVNPPINPTSLGSERTTFIVPTLGEHLALTNSFTVEGWLRPRRDRNMPNLAQQVLCGTRTYGLDSLKGWTIKWDAANQRFVLYANDDHSTVGGGAQVGDVALNTTDQLADWSGWKHFALVYDREDGNGSWTLYMDGVRLGSIQNQATPTCGNSSRHFYLGARPGDNQCWNGLFDCWRVTKRALAPQELLCWSGDDKKTVPNADKDVLAFWPLNVMGTHQLDLRDLKGTYTLREPLSGPTWEVAYHDDAPVINNPDVTTNFCGGAGSSRGAIEFKRANGGGRAFLYTSAYKVLDTFAGWNWTFETYVKRTSADFDTWDSIFMTFRQDKPWNEYPNLDLRFCYLKDKGFELEDNARFAGNHIYFGGAGALEDGKWHHVALAYASEGTVGGSAAFVCYLDGREVGRIEGTRKWTFGASWCAVFGGRPVSDVTTLHGCLSNMRLSNRVLSPDEFLCADKGSKPEPTTETIAYWPLESADGVSLDAANIVPNRPSVYSFFETSDVAGSVEQASAGVPLVTFPYKRENVGSAAARSSASFLRGTCNVINLGESFSVEGWLKSSGGNPGVEACVVGTYTGSIGRGWRLSFIDAATPELRLFARAGSALRTPNVDARFPLTGKCAIRQGEWSHVGLVYDQSVGRGVWTLYVNGRVAGVAENTWQNDMEPSETQFFYLGRYTSDCGCAAGFAGNFDMWRLTKGALTREELLNFYKKGLLMLVW